MRNVKNDVVVPADSREWRDELKTLYKRLLLIKLKQKFFSVLEIRIAFETTVGMMKLHSKMDHTTKSNIII